MKKITILIALLTVTIQFPGCGRPDDLDLSQTYFPFGLEYEWVYERHVWGFDEPYTEYEPERYAWDYYDTFSIAVTDSFLIPRGWRFELTNEGFRDVGVSPEINGNKIEVFSDMIRLEPEEQGTEYSKKLVIAYGGDTLILSKLKSDPEYYYKWEEKEITKRIEGIGVIKQVWYDWYSGNVAAYYKHIDDFLLWFIKTGDTVWNHEDTFSGYW